MKKGQRKGFTIVELLVVIAVIAVLAAVLIPVMVYLIDDAKTSADEQTVASLNKAIAAETGDIDTMSDAVAVAADYGYDVEKLSLESDENVLVWDQDSKYFGIVTTSGEEVYSNGGLSEEEGHLWVITDGSSDTVEESGAVTLSGRTIVAYADSDTVYSSYLAEGYEGDTEFAAGVDVGKNEDVDVSISYTGTASLIVNMNGGDLEIDAESAAVVQYGETDVTIVEAKEFTIYGTTMTIKVAGGSVVIDSSASVSYVAAATSDTTGISVTVNASGVTLFDGLTASEDSKAKDTIATDTPYAVMVSDFDTLSDALVSEAGYIEITLGADIEDIEKYEENGEVLVCKGTHILDIGDYSLTVKESIPLWYTYNSTTYVAVDAWYYGVLLTNYGTLTIQGEDGWLDSSAGLLTDENTIENYGKLTIDGGNFKGSLYGGAAVYNGEDAYCEINDGYFESGTAIYNDSGASMVINGGDFFCEACNSLTFDAYEYDLDTETYDTDEDMTTLKLSGWWSYCVISKGTIVFNGGNVLGVQGGISIVAGTAVINDVTSTTADCNTWESTPMGEDLQCDHSSHTKTSYYALYIAGESAGVTATVYGGTFTSGRTYALYIGNDNTDGDGGINADAYAMIYGGTFTAPSGINAVYVAYNTGNSYIYGGTYSTSTVSSSTSGSLSDFYNTSVYETVENSDGTYTVQAK